MSNKERVAVITGGSMGIGRAIALKFADEGAKLILVHFDADESFAEETIEMVSKAGGTAESRRVDVSLKEDVDNLFQDVIDKYGKVDVLVNNAGITRDVLLVRMSEEEWDSVLSINLKSVFNCSRSVIQPMMKQRYGRIVNLSSVVGQIGNASQINYSASKAGILGFTKSLAREVASRGITVNAVAPGYIETDMTAVLKQKVKDWFLAQIPMGRAGSPGDVAEVVYWLCSEAAAYITGQTIHVNGGMYCN
jgi:3-oxoacyl-[acyl-carrier protein] reductase